MEHRMHKRTPVRLRAVIYYREVPVDMGEVIEVSPTGARLKDISLDVPVGAALELELRPLETHAARGRMRGLVRHREGDRIGVFIHEGNEHAVRAAKEAARPRAADTAERDGSSGWLVRSG